MSIAQMNYLSALFYFMAGIFGALAAILYVAFDIRYIWKALRGNRFYRLKVNASRKERMNTTQKRNRKQRRSQKQNEYLKTLLLREQDCKLKSSAIQDVTQPIQEKTELLHNTTNLLERDMFLQESSTIPLELAGVTYPIKDSTASVEKKIHLLPESYTIPLELAHNIYAMHNSTTPLQENVLLLESTTMDLIQNIVYIDSNEAIPL